MRLLPGWIPTCHLWKLTAEFKRDSSVFDHGAAFIQCLYSFAMVSLVDISLNSQPLTKEPDIGTQYLRRRYDFKVELAERVNLHWHQCSKLSHR